MSNKKPAKIIISGYYGFGNCGDEAVLLAMISCLRHITPDAHIVVLSANPAETRRSLGVEAVNRWNPLRITLAILSCNLFISGGGSLLQDVTGPGSVKYYLGVIKIALFLRKKVMFYCQGVGPLSDEGNRVKVAKVLNRCRIVTVRDETSAQLLKDIGVRGDIHVFSDAVMALSKDDVDISQITDLLHGSGLTERGSRCRITDPSPPKSSDEPHEDEPHGRVNPLLLVSFRSWKENSHIIPVAELLDEQIKNGWDVLMIPAHFPQDREFMDKITAAMKNKPFRIEKSLTARQFITLTAYADKVFSMRLHGLICAMAMGTPIFALSYDPKVEAFMSQAGLSRYCLDYANFDITAAMPLLEELNVLSATQLQDIETRRAELQSQAWQAAQMAVEQAIKKGS